MSLTSFSVKSSRLKIEPSGPTPSTRIAYSVSDRAVWCWWLARWRLTRLTVAWSGVCPATSTPFRRVVNQPVVVVVNAVITGRQVAQILVNAGGRVVGRSIDARSNRVGVVPGAVARVGGGSLSTELPRGRMNFPWARWLFRVRVGSKIQGVVVGLRVGVAKRRTLHDEDVGHLALDEVVPGDHLGPLSCRRIGGGERELGGIG